MNTSVLLGIVVLLVLELATIARVLLRPHREPASRIAWLITVIAAPVLGMIAYLLLGEARLGRRRREHRAMIDARLPRPAGDENAVSRLAESLYAAPFALARTVNGLPPTSGNRATLLADSNAAIDALAADIDSTQRTAHLCFYIWLDDANGLKIKQALIRAAARGVKVRALADALGSRHFVRSAHWQDLRAAGVDARIALPVGNLVWTLLRGRVDLRNHRKLAVLDSRVAWYGSQNLADPEFRLKPRFAPWVDVMTRWEGPVALQSEMTFAADWMGEGGDTVIDLLIAPPPAPEPPPGAIIAQVIGTGPTRRHAAMTSCFAELIHSARHELVITTPYFVPDDQVLSGLLSAARRGVRTVLVLPRRNDSRIVAATSRSTYYALLSAGVEIHEFKPGLLHAKTLVVDGEIGLVGSANLDRRSAELNFENNVLFADPAFARELRERQDAFLAQSQAVTLDRISRDGVGTRLWQNFLAMMSPLL